MKRRAAELLAKAEEQEASHPGSSLLVLLLLLLLLLLILLLLLLLLLHLFLFLLLQVLLTAGGLEQYPQVYGRILMDWVTSQMDSQEEEIVFDLREEEQEQEVMQDQEVIQEQGVDGILLRSGRRVGGSK